MEVNQFIKQLYQSLSNDTNQDQMIKDILSLGNCIDKVNNIESADRLNDNKQDDDMLRFIKYHLKSENSYKQLDYNKAYNNKKLSFDAFNIIFEKINSGYLNKLMK